MLNSSFRQTDLKRKRFTTTQLALFVSLQIVLLNNSAGSYFFPSSFQNYAVNAYTTGTSVISRHRCKVGGWINRSPRHKLTSVTSSRIPIQTYSRRNRLLSFSLSLAAKAKPSQDLFASGDNEDEDEAFYDSFPEEDDNAAINQDSALLFGNDFLEGADDFELFADDDPQFDDNGDIVIPMKTLNGGQIRATNSYAEESLERFYDDEDTIEEEEDTSNANIISGDSDEDEVDDQYPEDDPMDTPLLEDASDPNYMAQMAQIEESVQNRDLIYNLRHSLSRSEDTALFMEQAVSEFLDEELDRGGVDPALVKEKYDKVKIVEKDQADILSTLQKEAAKAATISTSQNTLAFLRSLGSGADAFPSDDDPILSDKITAENMGQNITAIRNADLLQLQQALEELVGTIDGYTTGKLIDNKQAIIRPYYELERLDRQMVDEIYQCLNASAVDEDGDEYDEEVKSDDPLRILLYDLGFNVSNLMLAAFKHNPDAPIIMNHWMPQLVTYSRYADARKRKFQFTWDDVHAADLDELRRYYQGLGYNDIPTKTAKETNIVELESEYDPEDVYMSAFENWIEEVYQEEDENLYFDDEEFQPEQNVYDPNYGLDDSDHVKSFISELRDFEADFANETQMFRETFVKETNYTHIVDKEAEKEFRGHLIIACCGSEKDLDLAERITLRMEDEFGKKIHVETRVYNHARQEDNLYEIWLESYDIELIHSRRGAIYNKRKWDGKADIDDDQLNYIVDKVRHMISDDARYSYWLHEFYTEV